MIMDMPKPFVHRLRDLRIAQLEEQQKQRESPTADISGRPGIQNFQSTGMMIDEIVDELS